MRKPTRRGHSFGDVKKLVSLGIPGGAIPFIVKDLQANVCGMFGVDLDEALVLFEDELRRIQTQLGFVPLVTPTADIIAKQTIKSLGNRQRTAINWLIPDSAVWYSAIMAKWLITQQMSGSMWLLN